MKSGCLSVVLLMVTVLSLAANYIQYQAYSNGRTCSRSTFTSDADMSGQLKAVARSFGIRADEGRQESDILSDLRLMADAAERAPAACLPEKTVSELESVLTKEEICTLKTGQSFLKAIGGQKILIIKDEMSYEK